MGVRGCAPRSARIVGGAACLAAVLGHGVSVAQGAVGQLERGAVTLSAARAVSAGGLAVLSGRLRTMAGPTLVRAQRKAGRRWLTVASGTTSRAGAYALTFEAPTRPGSVVVRVLALRGRRLLATSPGRRLRVTPASGATITGAHAVVLDPSVVSSAPAPGAPGRLVYGGGDSVQAGQIIAIGVGPATPNGLLARATKATTRDGQTVVSTVPATLLEALPEGSIEAVLPTANQRTARAAASGAPAQPFSCTGSASATITAQESLSASLVLKADWRAGGGLQSASLTANASATGSVAADAQAALTCALAKTRFEQFAGPKLTFRVDGLIPIVLSSQVSVYAEAHVTTATAVSSSVTADFSASAGVGFTKSAGFAPIATFEPHLTNTPPAPTANAQVSANMIPTLGVLIDGLAGPQIMLSSGLNLTAETQADPWWTLTAPVELTASLIVPILRLASPALSVYQHAFLLAQAPTTLQITPTSLPTVTDCVPFQITLKASSDGAGGVDQWFHDAAPGAGMGSPILNNPLHLQPTAPTEAVIEGDDRGAFRPYEVPPGTYDLDIFVNAPGGIGASRNYTLTVLPQASNLSELCEPLPTKE